MTSIPLSYPARRWLAMVALLIAETELTVVPNYEIRTALRDLAHVPLYHLLLGFLGFALLIRFLAAERLAPIEDRPLSSGFLAAHLVYFAVLNRQLSWLWELTLYWPTPSKTLAWAVVLALYLGSWLAILIPPRQWLAQLRQHGPWMAFSLALAGLAVLAAESTTLLWIPMAQATMSVTGFLLRLLGETVTSEPDRRVLGVPDFQVIIDPGCSGYQGMGLIALFIATYLWIRRAELRLPLALLLLPVGIVINWLANSVRIAALILIGAYLSPAIATRGFHSQAGWIAFSTIGILLLVLVEKWKVLHRRSGAEHLQQVEYPAAPYVVPLLALLLAKMVCAAFTEDFDIYYPFRIIVLLAVLLAYRARYQPRFGGFSWLGVGVGLLVYLIWASLVPGQAAVNVDEVLLQPWALGWLVFRISGSVLVIPVVEELAFRGYLLRRLQGDPFEDVPWSRLSPVSLTVSSLAFGLLHGEAWIAGTLAGLAYAWAMGRHGRLGDAVLAHAVTNLCVALQVLLLGHWSLWN